MSQLMINDLSFYQSDLPEPEAVKGSGSFFDFDFDVAFDSLFNPAGDAAAGFALGAGLAIGDNLAIIIGTGTGSSL